MQAKRVWAMYWSATGTTKRVVTTIAAHVAQVLGVPLKEYDFTLTGRAAGGAGLRTGRSGDFRHADLCWACAECAAEVSGDRREHADLVCAGGHIRQPRV